MAFRRSVSATRATLLARKRFTASFSYIHHDDGRTSRENQFLNSAILHRSMGICLKGFKSSVTSQKYAQFFAPSGTGSFYIRHMSTIISKGANEIEYATGIVDTTEELEAAVVSAVPAMTEVSIAAADSALPVAAAQYFIGHIHLFTGCNWWASIVVATLLIRAATVPLAIYHQKSSVKLKVFFPHYVKLLHEMQDKCLDPKAVEDFEQRKVALCNEYGVDKFTFLKSCLQAPIFISFYLAISNMVDKVPSFKSGGAYWSTDLTAPDSLCIFPALIALSFWAAKEINMPGNMEKKLAAKIVKMSNMPSIMEKVIAPLVKMVPPAVVVLFTMNYAQAFTCYFATQAFFSLVFGFVCKAPVLQKFLATPDLPVAVIPTAGGIHSSFLEQPKKSVEHQAEEVTSSHHKRTESAGDKRVATSSPAIKFGRLKKQVKGRKKSNRR